MWEGRSDLERYVCMYTFTQCFVRIYQFGYPFGGFVKSVDKNEFRQLIYYNFYLFFFFSIVINVVFFMFSS